MASSVPAAERRADVSPARPIDQPQARTRPLRAHLLVLLAYSALALLLTWPLARHITTHVPGMPQWAFDEATFVWNVWYFKHSAIDTLTSPLHSNLIYYPLGIDLILYTYNFYHALAALPLALATNLVFASNVTLLASTVLSAYGTWLLVRYLFCAGGARLDARANAAAFVAGLAYAFASNRAVYAALGHYDMVTTQWIPFYALMLLRSLDAQLGSGARRNSAALAGLFFAFNGLAEMITALFLAIFTVIVLLAQPANETAGERRPVIARPRLWLPSLIILGAVAFAVWSPVLVPIVIQFVTDDFSLKGWGEAIPLSADLLGWFTPTTLHPLFGGDVAAELRRVQLRALEQGVTGFRDLNTVFLGWVTLALAIVGALAYQRRVRLWVWTAVLFGLFTLGPFLQIDGEYRFDLDGIAASIPLPYALLHYLPVIKANRAPNRNSVVLMLALAVLAGYGVWWIVQRIGRRDAGVARPAWLALGGAGLLGALVLFEHLGAPLPLSDMRVPAVYEQIAAQPGNQAVMQIPLGWRNSFGVFGPEQTIFQFYQSAHGKPMLGGNISRAPDFKLEYFQRIPFFQALTEIEFGREVSPELLEAARTQAGELMRLYDVGTVILYPPIPGKPPFTDTWQATWDFVKQAVPLEESPFWAQDGIEAYRVVQPEGDNRFTLDLGAPGSFPYRGAGWDSAETDTVYDAPAVWAVGEEAELFLPLRGVEQAAEYDLRLRVRPFAWTGSAPQTVRLAVNGAPQGDPVALADGWQEVAWRVPAAALTNGLNRVRLEWGYAVAPRAVVPGSREIGATGVALPVDADLKAFADGAFMALFDAEGQQSDASAGKRGVNVTVLDQRTGDILMQDGYDTGWEESESARLAAALRGVEPGRIVLAATLGDANAHLTPEAIEALRGIGAEISPYGPGYNVFAIVGVQGAAPGTAAVVVDPAEAFLRVSLNRDRRPLAAAVGSLSVEPVQ